MTRRCAPHDFRKNTTLRHRLHSPLSWLWAAIALALCVGILDRGYWTPDEPREADIAWRMSWQADKAVPLLAGEAFCEKPPLTYWVSGAAIRALGLGAWAARLPNLLYALATALAVGLIGRRRSGPIAGLVAAAAISTFLLSYQVAIWLATDAPLLGSVAVALWGLNVGFYAQRTAERLRGYSCMHAALALGFLSKSAAAWMVPALALLTLVVWERRYRELWRWELYVGLAIQAVLILTWVGFVYVGSDGPAHLKVFFWNNLAGRFAHIDAPEALQYAAAHRNSPGKYLVELPVYLWPWTLLVIAAARRAWQQRQATVDRMRLVRFALAVFVPTLAVLSVAATARNIYLAPALPGLALLLGWWARDLPIAYDRWDARALYATSVLLLLGVIIATAAVAVIGAESWAVLDARITFIAVSVVGLAVATIFALSAWRAVRCGMLLRGLAGLLIAYCALLIGPASQVYRRIDAWQDLGSIGRALRRDVEDRPLVLFAPDETTRAFVDMYAFTSVGLIPAPATAASIERLRAQLALAPQSVVMTQLPGRSDSRFVGDLSRRLGLPQLVAVPRADNAQPPLWAAGLKLHVAHRYALPNGRRYELLEAGSAVTSR
jgi:4-amino-4-deoxy-L-arabinose transferase-like glycosyltransferase